MITLLTPIWLLLALPLGLSLWVWRMPTRVLTVMRIITVALVLAGLASVAVRLPSRSGTVIVVADRSLSMPGEAGRSELESIGLVHKKLRGNDQLGVVTFGRIAATEQAPQTSVLSAFANDVGDDASNLHDAIDRALSLIPPDGPGRVLVLSDGRWTGKDPSAGAARAAARGVGIDYRSIERPATSDLAIASIDAPMSVNPREVYMITAWV
ncbi:MAG: hypothetical protein GC162_18150 [Planctomycetes bacterium]|nr:hypothetical protein [Planctomycetota bacterium]